jgi:hypothetical protein
MLEYRKNGLTIIFETQWSIKIVLNEYSTVRGEGGPGPLEKMKIFKFFWIRSSKSDIFEPSHFRTFEIHGTDPLKLINGPPQVTPRARRCRSERHDFRSSFSAALGTIPERQGRDPSKSIPWPESVGEKGWHPDQTVLHHHRFLSAGKFCTCWLSRIFGISSSK